MDLGLHHHAARLRMVDPTNRGIRIAPSDLRVTRFKPGRFPPDRNLWLGEHSCLRESDTESRAKNPESCGFARYLTDFTDNLPIDMNQPTRSTIERVLAGELDQYREIVRTFEADVFRLAAPILGSRSAAEDVTQEAFVTAYRRLDSFDLAEPFRPWLLGIAANLVRNELRRRRRENVRMELYSHYLDAMTSSDASPKRSEAMSDALATCREQLAKTASAAIRGRYDEGLGLEALADRLQRSVDATRQLLYRTKRSLRDCIEIQLASEGGDP